MKDRITCDWWPPYNEAIMVTTLNSDLATEFRYALDVMEKYSHLGLDDE